MLYRILKGWLRIGYRVYFNKILINGLEKIDWSKPAIFAVNHPTAFIEPTLIATSVSHPIHFMTRGDVFKGNFMWFFNATNQVPVFRFKDGFSNMRSNKESFEKCHQKLIDYQKLIIFCEGGMLWEKRLRKVQQGAAKLAFGTLEKSPNLPLMVHPIGVNYDHPGVFRSDVMIEVGEAISVQKWKDQYNISPRPAILELTEELENSLIQLVIHIEHKKDRPLIESLWKPVKNHNREIAAESGRRPFEALKNTVEAINGMEYEEKEVLKEKVQNYSKCLATNDFSDDDLLIINRMSKWLYPLVLVVGLILHIIRLANMPPLWLAEKVSKDKTPNTEFFVSVRFVLGAFLYTMYLAVLLIVAILLPINWLWFLVIPLGGWLELKINPFSSAVFKYFQIKNRTEWFKKAIKERRKLVDHLAKLLKS